jgi:catechol 2,3-dioxygenase-like lactoylglutathione lyase family enzyme
MIDHVSVRVQDFPRLLAFYRDALAPIGYSVIMEYPGAVGLGAHGKPDLWLMQTEQAVNATHVALSSARRDLIDAFHAAGLAAGGTDNGPPGLRVDYHPTYYAAYVRDPEGNNIEVVCHAPPKAPRTAKAARPAAKGQAKASKKTAAKKPAKAKAKKKKR